MADTERDELIINGYQRDVQRLERELADLRRELEPSPCGVAGHRLADAVDECVISVPSVGPGDESVGKLARQHCGLCAQLSQVSDALALINECCQGTARRGVAAFLRHLLLRSGQTAVTRSAKEAGIGSTEPASSTPPVDLREQLGNSMYGYEATRADVTRNLDIIMPIVAAAIARAEADAVMPYERLIAIIRTSHDLGIYHEKDGRCEVCEILGVPRKLLEGRQP